MERGVGGYGGRRGGEGGGNTYLVYHDLECQDAT